MNVCCYNYNLLLRDLVFVEQHYDRYHDNAVKITVSKV
jgi:hypothetical protein